MPKSRKSKPTPNSLWSGASGSGRASGGTVGNRATIEQMRIGGVAHVGEGASGQEVLGGVGEGASTFNKAAGLGGKLAKQKGLDTPALDGLSKASDAAGLLGSGVDLYQHLDDPDPFAVMEAGVGVGDDLTSVLGMDRLNSVFSVGGHFYGMFNGIRGAADEDQSTGERWNDGVGALGDGLSLGGILGGAPMSSELLAMSMTELPALAPAMSAGGALLGSWFFGKGAGDLWARAGDSEWARELNLGGYDDDGNERTLGDFWTDVAVGANQGIDSAGRGADAFLDRKSQWLGDQVDDKLGFGGSVVEEVGDVLGDGIEIGADYLGGAAGSGIALGMGTFAGLADGASAVLNYMTTERPLSEAQQEALDHHTDLQEQRMQVLLGL